MPETPRTLTSLNILIVEDSINDTALLLTKLKAAGFDPHWKRVETETDYLAQLGPDLAVILADFSLPQFSTIGALALLQEQTGDSIHHCFWNRRRRESRRKHESRCERICSERAPSSVGTRDAARLA